MSERPVRPAAAGPTSRAAIDIIAPVGLALPLVLSAAIVSRRTPMWYDEILTWVEVTDPSLPHMLSAISDGAESAPPFYHLLAWFWCRVFGTSEMAFRLFTATAFAVAAATLWITLRRPFGRFGATVATAAAIGGSELILNLNRQGRFYGLFMLDAVIIVYLFARIARRGPSIGLGIALYAAHVALLYTHIFGIVFSAALGTASILWDLIAARRPRATTSGAVVLAWLSFLPWLPSMQRQMEPAKPSLWIPRVGIHDLFVSTQFGIVLLPLCIALLGGLFMLAARSTHVIEGAEPSAPYAGADVEEAPRRALLLAALLLLLVPVGIWVLQYVTSPVFVPRYMIPSVVGLAIALAAVAQRAGETLPVDPWWQRMSARSCRVILVSAFVAFPFYYAAAYPAVQRQDRQLEAASPGVPASTPVVAEVNVDFAPLVHYQGVVPRAVYFMEDSAFTVSPGTAPGALSAIKAARAYTRNDYFPGLLIRPDTLFARHSRFLVIDQPHITWFEQRITPDARFRSCMVGRYQDIPLRLVTRVGDPLCESLVASAGGDATTTVGPR